MLSFIDVIQRLAPSWFDWVRLLHKLIIPMIERTFLKESFRHGRNLAYKIELNSKHQKNSNWLKGAFIYEKLWSNIKLDLTKSQQSSVIDLSKINFAMSKSLLLKKGAYIEVCRGLWKLYLNVKQLADKGIILYCKSSFSEKINYSPKKLWKEFGLTKS